MFNGEVMKNNIYTAPVYPSGPLSFMQFNTLLAGECKIDIAYEKTAYKLINMLAVKYVGADRGLNNINDTMNRTFDEIKDDFIHHMEGPLYRYVDIMSGLKAYFVFYQDFRKQYLSGVSSSENIKSLQEIQKKVSSLNAIIEDSYAWTNNTLSHLDNYSVLLYALSSAVKTSSNIPVDIINESNDIKKKKEDAIEVIKQKISHATDNAVALRAVTGVFSSFQSQNPPCSVKDLVEVSLTKLPEDTDGVSDYLRAIKREIEWFKKIQGAKPEIYQLYELVSNNASIANYCTMINEMMTLYSLEIKSISADCQILSKRIDRLLQIITDASDHLDPFYLNIICDDWFETISKWQKINPQ